VSRLREAVDAWLCKGIEAAVVRASSELELEIEAARQLVDYLAAARAVLSAMPTEHTLVLERFFDETGSMHLVLHCPLGTRVNRAFGLALRKRFCRSFNVELQAAANDDAIVLSLGPMHSFELDDVYRFLRASSVRDVLAQALLAAPMFNVRFRWNASRALAVPRFQGGKKVAPRFQRMLADDLLAVAFPDQVACAENLAGEREIPDHPLVRQTLHDCLHEAMDIEALEALLSRIATGEVACLSRDLTEPSPLAQEILNAKPYAFLDDAPLEERRTQAVMQRRFVDPARASDLSALDAEAIQRVVEDVAPDARDADELHDYLLVHAALPEAYALERGLLRWFDELVVSGRAARLSLPSETLWVAAERSALLRLAYPHGVMRPELAPPLGLRLEAASREQALIEVVRGRLDATGPVSLGELATSLGLDEASAQAALGALEAEGVLLRGRFRPGAEAPEWCERRLLARIHRATLERLRRDIEPVSPAVLMRFLLRFQHVAPGSRLRGPEGLYALIEQLAGFELSAGAWEQDVLPARMEGYDPGALDLLSLTGRVSWARLSVPSGKKLSTPIRTTPIALFPRELSGLLGGAGRSEEPELSHVAARVAQVLAERGASFVHDLVTHSGLLKTQVEQGLSELVAQGRVSSDGFAGLRALLSPPSGRVHPRHGRGRAAGLDAAGRYGLLPPAREPEPERFAQRLLLRWGVVFRRLVEREPQGVPWGELLRVLRRMEARGEVRGGRFVSGFSGEQYALPDAVGLLRKLRREEPRGELVSLSAVDPLNLCGVITPGPRLPAIAASRVLLRDGVPVATLSGGACQFLVEVPSEERFELERALRRHAGTGRAKERGAIAPGRGRPAPDRPNSV
jgi:ATP-dependent Lhr-like helicase